MNWYLDVLKKYAVFNGRARRQEYWMYMLFNLIAYIVVAVVDVVLTTQPLLTGIYALGVFLPTLGVTVRRLHDTGRSGWWILIGAIPLVGFIILIVFYATEGNQTDNSYGPNPKLAPAY
ncbi:DUF805 domain-containing protein [Streptomyces sp. P9(2023)]|uniref:DUF805 domain-containing protein n=1 Tax=Streptomyces sp. P9(2023) TaxID=3064394 RepID=UPI0028F40A71|nr:DUF805 domain-containing protein [Streptomyces sp. P9(2023)]MDT9689055.1 DUF805 domain-containing protein [Streptomyces sp. P9(2023)]